MLSHRQHLEWPFFEPRHRALAAELNAWCVGECFRPDHFTPT